MDEPRRSRLRILAPAALVAFGLAFLVVVASSGTEKSASPEQSAERPERGQDGRGGRGGRPRPSGGRREAELPSDVYIVQAGDTLGTIAEKVGLSVDRLEELNPQIDPQTLVAGQRIKLRE